MNRFTRISVRGVSTAILAVALIAACNSDKATAPDLSPKNPGTGTGLGGIGHGPALVPLGSAGNYVILAKSAVSNVPTSAVTGDIGLSPSAASFITGFSLVHTAGTASGTSAQVTGTLYAADYAVPTPTTLTTAISDMQTAYVDAAGRSSPDHTELA